MHGDGFSENVSILDKAPDRTSAVGTVLHFEGDDLITQRFQNMEPVLQHVKELREANEGKNWGEGRIVGHLPALYRAKFTAIKDRTERDAAVLNFFRTHPQFVSYDNYLKR